MDARSIYLFRHAKSSWADPGLSDFERPLAPRGERAVATMRAHMEKIGVAPQLVLCSSALRTRQTLDGVLPALGREPTVEFERGLYLQSVGGLLDRLRQVPDAVTAVMFVGHNPGMQGFALALAGVGPAQAFGRIEAKFPTAALATLAWQGRHWREIGKGACTLRDFVVPREL